MDIKETKFEVEESSILLIQLSGRTSSAVFTAAQIRPGASWQLDNFLRPQGAFPQAFTPFRGGLGSLPGAWGAPNKGNADGAEGIFGKLRARVGYGPAPGPTQKRSCAIHARKVGRASNTAVFCWFSCRVTLRPAVLAVGQIWPGVSRQLDKFLRPQGAFPSGFYSLQGGWVNCPAPEAPLIWGIPTGP